MKLDKFKKLSGNISTPDLPDNDYIRSLYNLPQKSHRTPILPIIGTVAASLVIVLGITIWALIGRGIRNADTGGDTQIIMPSDESEGKGENKPDKKPSDKNEQKPDDKNEQKQPDDTEEQKQPDEQKPDNNETPPQVDDKENDEQKPNDTPDNVVVVPDNDNDNTDVKEPEQDTEIDTATERELSAKRAEVSKLTYAKSPLLNGSGSENKSVLPSFDIDSTSFVRDGTKLSDLKSKTLVFFTNSRPYWSYRDSAGKTVTEWDWVKELKNELGLNIKYTLAGDHAAESSKNYMTSGKQLDILYTTGNDMLEMLSLSRDITSLININDNGSSPGICKKTMDGYALTGGYRVIAPVGNVDVLWSSYGNQLTQKWRDDSWDYASFGASCQYFTMEPRRAIDAWACTKGYFMSSITTNAPVSTVTSNWGQTPILSHINEIKSLFEMVEASHHAQSDMYCYEYENIYKNVSYSKSHVTATYEPITDHSDISAKGLKLRWAPYPRHSSSSTYSAPSLGYGMLLPKSTVKPDNIGAALKFCELWASRMTESILDNLSIIEYYDFSYDERKEYHDFCVSSTVTPLYLNLDMGNDCHIYDMLFPSDSFEGTSYKLADEWQKTSSIANNDIISKLKSYS